MGKLVHGDVTTYQIDPLADPRWDRLSLKHPNSSVFHTSAWLKALQRTYQYEPVVLTSSPPDQELTNGLVFCRIRSRLTGNRAVSLPFSDHCEPLYDGPGELERLLSGLKGELRHGHANYIEIRPIRSKAVDQAGFFPGEEFCIHRMNLRDTPDTLFSSFHTNIKRNIRRAEREGLRYEDGSSDALLEDFYRLLILTRRRHQLPPQPLSWFHALLDCMPAKAHISIAYKNDCPIAGILTLRHNDVLVYKYGCLDYRYRQFGALTSLLWRTIQRAQRTGILELDLGRSNSQDLGLIAFKDRWAAVRSKLTYWMFGACRVESAAAHWTAKFGARILARMPDMVFTTAGRVLYRHAG
jgi:hypothetical protein